MFKIRVLLILSLALLAALGLATVFRPLAKGKPYTEVARQQLLQKADGWIIQLDLLNREGRPTSYTVTFSVAGQEYQDRFRVQDGSKYTYIHHIPRGTAREASFSIAKEGEDTPFEQGTYYLD